jgi:hypothetical protein
MPELGIRLRTMLDRKKLIAKLKAGAVHGVGSYIGYNYIAGTIVAAVSVALGAVATWIVWLGPREMTRYEGLVITMQVAVTAMALFCAAVLIYPRVVDICSRWLSKPKSATRPTEAAPPDDLSRALCIVDMRVGTHRLREPASWLEFHCTGFNGCAHRANVASAQGRIRFNRAEFHQRLELERQEDDAIEPYTFFLFSLRLPLSDSEAVHLLNSAAENHLVIIFKNAVVSGTVDNGTTFALSVLPTVQFRQPDGNASPPYPTQAMR